MIKCELVFYAYGCDNYRLPTSSRSFYDFWPHATDIQETPENDSLLAKAALVLNVNKIPGRSADSLKGKGPRT